jgi:hypothetical protein
MKTFSFQVVKKMSSGSAVNEYMMALSKSLTGDRGLAESTAASYIRTLFLLNNKKPFKSLAFLKKREDVLKKVGEYAETTQRSILGAICSVLSLVKDKPAYKKTYEAYRALMMEKKGEGEKELGTKTEKEEKAWLKWDDVKKRLDELKDQVEALKGEKTLNSKQFDVVLAYAVLALYTLVPPRRNQDYTKAVVVKKWSEKLPTDRNYLDLGGVGKPTQFIFNVYKTAKKHGQYKEPIPEELSIALNQYLLRHPGRRDGRKMVAEYPFLVNASNEPLTAVNSITRILNKIFKRNVGSSMLRHIYLSDKYDIDEIKKDAAAMGHSVAEQRNYLRTDGPTLTVSDE